jgi:hypothetical protein
MRHTTLLFTCTTWLALGCGDGGTGPAPESDGRRLAAQFERLADSVESGGYSPAAEALRHAGEIVRLTGHATPVVVTIDGVSRNFLAVAEQLDFPNLICSWPSDSGVVPPPDTTRPPPVDSTGVTPPDIGGVMPGDTVVGPPVLPECTVVGTHSMRTLIAWEPEQMAEVVRIVADVGNNTVAAGVPDVMTGLPAATVDSSRPGIPPDSGSGSGGEPGGFPGFMGEYLVRNVGSWWAVEGSQRNELEDAGGACTDNRATFDWAEFDCEAARLRFELEMTVESLRYEPLTGVIDPPDVPVERHTVSMRPSMVDGVRLTWVAWTPPPEPLPPEPEPAGPDPIPVDPTP